MPSTSIKIRRYSRTEVLVKQSELISVAVEEREDDIDLGANSRDEPQAMALAGSCESICPASDQFSAIKRPKRSNK